MTPAAGLLTVEDTTEAATMDSSQVTRRQAQAIKSRVEEMRDYLYRLRIRMSKRGFPPDDPLYMLVVEAQQSIGELYMDCCNRAYGGPTSTPPANKTAWLQQRSARKRVRDR
jgi:hypothetical protein